MADKWKPVPYLEGAYSDDSRTFTSQDTVNYLYVGAEQGGARSSAILRSVPGLKEFVNIAGVTRQRGARNVEGRLFVVVDTSLYQITPLGGISLLGEIAGHDRVSMSHNQIANGNQLLIVTGTFGYIYDTVAQTLTKITDDAFEGGVVCDFIDQMFVVLKSQRREFQNSAIADGLSWNALEDYQSESKPDRIRSIIVANGELTALGEQSIDHFASTGVVNDLFQDKKIPIDRGCAATYAVSSLDNAVFFIGNDGSGYLKRGYNLQRITTHAIEQAWATCDISKAYSFTWEDKGHKVWYVTFPDGHTWGYDVSVGRWHRRESYGMDRWRLAWLVQWRNEWYGGEYNSGRIFKLDWEYHGLEGSDILSRERTSGVLHNDGNWIALHGIRFEIDFSSNTTVPIEVAAQTAIGLQGDLADQALGATVSYDYTVVGGIAPFVLTKVSGAWPTGVTMNTAGHFSGTTTATGLFSWRSKVTDSIGQVAYLDDTCLVSYVTSPRYVVGTNHGNAWIATTGSVGSFAQHVTGLSFAFVMTSKPGVIVLLDGSDCAVSTDRGLTWTVHAGVFSAHPTEFTDAIYSPTLGLFIAVGRTSTGHTNTGAIWTSPDGVAWTYVNLNEDWFWSVAELSGRIIVVGEATPYQSTNGTSFTALSGTGALRKVGVHNGDFYALAVGYGGSTAIYKLAGTSWSLVSNSGAYTTYAMQSFASGPGGVIGSLNQGSSYDGIYLSTDNFLTWTRVVTTTPLEGTAACYYGAGAYMVVGGTGGSGIWISTDNAATWGHDPFSLADTSTTCAWSGGA